MRKYFLFVGVLLIPALISLVFVGCSKAKTNIQTTTSYLPTQTTTKTSVTTTSTTIATNTSTPLTTSAPSFTVNVGTKAGIGTFLIDGKGMTLYWTSLDLVNLSKVTGTTLAVWPIFYASNINVSSSLNASDFGSIKRDDGNTQITFKGWPLYYYASDSAPGDTLGQGVGGVWFAVNPTASGPITTPTSSSTTTTTVASFPYQGSGTGTWSGQITYNNKTYSVSGGMSVIVDADGVFSGSISSNTTGGTADTTITAQVDKNGNLAGTVSFTISGITFTTNWQGKMTVSGNAMSMQGTWTSQYGSGTFSGSGTSSK